MDALEAAVAASPDDPAPLLVWADALIAKGDPLGEFVALSYAHTKETDPSRFVRTRARLAELQSAHHHQWLLDGQVAEETWRWGLLRRCAVSADPERLHKAKMASEDAPLAHLALLVDELRRVLESPAGQFLEDAALQLPAGLVTLSPLLALANAHRLRGLVLSLPSASLTLRLDDAPRVTRWRLQGVPLDPGTTLPPAIERLELLDAPLFPGAEELLAAPAPALTTLALRDEHLDLARLVTRLSRATHPALRRLTLADDLADDVLLALSGSPLLAQLDELTVHGPFSDAGLEAVVNAAARFDRLTRLVLSGGGPSSHVKRAAFRRLPRLELPARAMQGSWTGW